MGLTALFSTLAGAASWYGLERSMLRLKHNRPLRAQSRYSYG
jgi:hypothetical protein